MKTESQPHYSLNRELSGVTLAVSGDWLTRLHLPDPSDLVNSLFSSPKPLKVSFNCSALNSWDTGLLRLVLAISVRAEREGVEFDSESLPDGLRKLYVLAQPSADAITPRKEDSSSLLIELGEWGIQISQRARDIVAFVGEMSRAVGKLVVGQSRMRFSEFIVAMFRSGPEALPIVTLISLLVGLILALIGAVQLQQFGAQIYIANLVGIGMTREMGAVMAGIILAGRTGAAFAAELGTMQGNEEIDALTTLGVPVTEYLVLPRMLALMLMMPFLCLYADLMGIAGGGLASWIAFSISPWLYITQIVEAVKLSDLFLGISKGFVFGILVALSGCYCGMSAERSSEAVGRAATSAVVSSIVLIVIADAVFSVLAQLLEI